jgi:hypothetical protein
VPPTVCGYALRKCVTSRPSTPSFVCCLRCRMVREAEGRPPSTAHDQLLDVQTKLSAVGLPYVEPPAEAAMPDPAAS